MGNIEVTCHLVDVREAVSLYASACFSKIGSWVVVLGSKIAVLQFRDGVL